MTNINTKDLNLLSVFEVIWLEKNISRAADKLCLSQPAISHSLKRLREQFDDPLFVRSSKGVTPTDFAISIAPSILKVMSETRRIYSVSEVFSPYETERDLHIAIGDHFALTLYHLFLKKLSLEAPKVRISAKPVTEFFPIEDLENGKTDIAITGFYASAPSKSGFHKKKVLEEDFFCLGRRKHPLINKKLTANAYLKAEHLYISPIGDFKGFIDIDLAKSKKKRDVKATLPSFAEAGPVLANSDLLLTAPKGICTSLAVTYGLEAHKLPFKIRTYRACLHWHDRTQTDPFQQWVRSTLFQLFEDIVYQKSFN